MSAVTNNKKPELSQEEMDSVLGRLAENGITVDGSGKLEQDKSIHFYNDGHLYDHGRGGHYYHDIKDLLEKRPDLVNAPVQANKYSVKMRAAGKLPTDFMNKQSRDLHGALIEFHELEEKSLLNELDELLPADWYKDGFSSLLGYAPGNKLKTLSVSAIDEDGNVHATCYRRAKNREGEIVKWRTDGSKRFIPSKLTGQSEVYLASGMGELVMLEILGVDYICLQSDGMANHLSEPKEEIQHLIILPDNDNAFMKRVDAILSALNPKKASIVKWEYSDPREAALALKTMDTFMTEVSKCMKEIDVSESDVVKEVKAVNVTENSMIDMSGISTAVLSTDVVEETETKIRAAVRQTVDMSKPLVNTFKIHPEANETALMTDELFNNLVGMIEEQTQLVPVLLWYNKKTKGWELVDGRHRVEACNILRIKVKTFKLDKSITEDALPMAILSIQLGNKIIDTTIASCEAVRYIERFDTRGLQAELIRKFGAKLKGTSIKHLKNIRRIEPLWFETLRLGNSVEYEKGKHATSLSMLAKLCLEKEKALLGSENKDVKIGDKEIAIAFKKMTPHIDALLSVAGKEDSNMYAIKKLLEDNANISLASIHVKEELEKQRNELNKREGIINSIQRRLDAYENLFSEMQKKGIINTRKLGKLHAFKLLKNL